MRILFNCLSLKKGGAERVITTLANNFIKDNEVSIITLGEADPAYDLDKKINVVSLGNKNENPIIRKISLRRLFRLKKAILREKPDIALSFLPEPSLKLMLLKCFSSKIKNIPIIISIRNDPEVEFRKPLIHFTMCKLYRKANGFVFQTHSAQKYFDGILNPKTPRAVIMNPLNEQFIVPKPYSGIRDKTIISVGRLEPQKNHAMLIDAFKNIHEKLPDYELIIYGEGSLRKKLEQQISDLNLQHCVSLPGQVDNIKNKIYKASCFVLSSNYEGMPNALMEAMALGVPCVATNCPCGGPKELKDLGLKLFLIPVGDMEALSEAIYKTHDETVSQKTLDKIKNIFSPTKIADKWYNIIEEILLICQK